MPHTTTRGAISKEMQQCIKDCLECYATCEATVQHCLEMGGPHAEARHIGLLLDCAEICRTSADLMLRGSEHSGHVCGVCADICRACEESCRRIGDDEQMRKCAEICRRCAESCQRMARAA